MCERSGEEISHLGDDSRPHVVLSEAFRGQLRCVSGILLSLYAPSP